MKDNIFDYPGQAVNKVHSFRHWDYPDMNAGVTKWTREECEIMKEHIDEFYHPTHNQASINACFKKYCGEITFLPYKFNVTHRPTNETVLMMVRIGKLFLLTNHSLRWRDYLGISLRSMLSLSLIHI